MSTEGNAWCVRSAGVVIEGFSKDTVVKNFAKTFNISDDKAAPYLQKDKLIRKDLKEVEANHYKSQLEKMGLAVTVQDQSATVEARIKPATLSLVPSDNEAANDSTNLSSSAAPAGRHSSSCSNSRLAQENIVGERTARNSDIDRSRREITDTRNACSYDDNELPIIAIAAAVVAALVFAFIWQFIAIQFDRELGVIAWAAGCAIGGVAAILGGRGTIMVGICACLLVVSIFLGKYMFASSYLDEAITYMETTTDENWVDAVYDEIASEREAYAAIPKDNNSIKRFMVDYGYTESTRVALVPPDDLEYFKDEIEPWLLLQDEDENNFDDAQTPPDFAAAMAQITPWTIVKDSLGLLDIVFLLLGLTTAFRLAQAGQHN